MSNVRKTSTFLALALALALAGCGSKKPIEQAPQAVQTKRISSDPTAANGALRFSAVVEPDARVPVSFRIPGYVTAIKKMRLVPNRSPSQPDAGIHTASESR